MPLSAKPENCENRNDPDLVQAFLKKWWVESDFKTTELFVLMGAGCRMTERDGTKQASYFCDILVTQNMFIKLVKACLILEDNVYTSILSYKTQI
jgi:hypothetical protein